MAIVGFLLRAEIRHRWRQLALITLLIGVVGGVALWGANSARRTATAYDRLAEVTNAEDVLVNPDDGNADLDRIKSLKMVTDACHAYGAPVALRNAAGEPSFDEPLIPFVTDGHCLFDLAGPARVDGRLPDPDKPYEVFLARSAADALELEAGDELPAFVFESEDAEPQPILFHVTGTGVFASDVLLDPNNEATYPVMVLTPAFGKRHPVDPNETFEGLLVQLRRGERDVAAFNAAALEAAGEAVHFEDRFENARKASRAIEPYVFALWLVTFGVAAAGAGMLGGALHRALSAGRRDRPTLEALGVTPGAHRAVSLILGLAVGACAAIIAIGVAMAASPLAPIGPSRAIEPDPGFHAEPAILVMGAAVTLLFGLLTAALALITARIRPRSVPVGRVGLFASTSSAPTAMGIRLATGGLRGRRAGARSTVVGGIVGVVAVVAVELMGAGIGRLAQSPERFGWDWDLMVNVYEDEYGPDIGPNYQGLVDDLDAAGVTERTTLALNQLDVAGVPVAAIGVSDVVGPAVIPTVLKGREPRTDDEIVLGATTASRAGVGVGDRVPVRAGKKTRRMSVVGISTFPRLTEYPGAPNTGLGDGAMTTSKTLSELTGALPYATMLVRADGDVLQQVRKRVTDEQDFDSPVVRIERPQRPDALYGYESVARLRHVLAGLLGLLAVVTVALGLSSSARTAGHDLAVFRTLGATPAQTRRSIYTQGLIVAVITACVGAVLGITAGRLAWRAFADRLGVPHDALTPAADVAGVVVVSIAVCLAVALVVAHTATRHSPGTALRSE